MKIPLLWLKDYIQTDKSAQELADSFTQLGLMLDKPLEDNVLDLEHRLDRSDWLSIVGCARDLAAFENIPFTPPKIVHHKSVPSHKLIPITVKTSVVHRFQTRIFRGIKVRPSPSWLADRLTAYGIKPINNVVDITNFVMVELGQPMHAQDIAKLKVPEITIRPAKKGEKLTTLLGTEVTLDPATFVLSSGGQVTVIGGIVGGAQTGVTNTTTDILLDAGNYDSHVVRATSRRLKIINETVSRYDKFLDPRAIDIAFNRATDLILSLAGGSYSENSDYYPNPVIPQTQTLTLARLQLISGLEFTLATAKKILRSLDYAIIEENKTSLTVEVPYFRTDVEVEDDLIADILRIYNYANLPTMSLTFAVPTNITPSILSFSDQLRDLLVAQGLHEHITNSLITFTNESGQIKLANALNNDQNALRTSILPSLSHVALTYTKHKISKPQLFEIGQVFLQAGNSYQESSELCVLSNNAKDHLATLFSSLNIRNYILTPDYQIKLGNTILGSYTQNSFCLNIVTIFKHFSPRSQITSEFTHPITLDISLLAPINVSYADIISTLYSIKVHYQSISCKSTTIVGKQRNYLLSIIWPEGSHQVESDKLKILTTLAKKLNVTSKS